MGNIELVINIDTETYNDIKRGKIYSSFRDVPLESVNAIANGKPLPKGHGRLIDADELEELFGKKCVGDCGCCITKRKTDGRGRWYDTCSLIDSSSTIIEADKG